MTIGYLALNFGGEPLTIQVLQSAAGFYIGTYDEGPYSRESVEYFPTREDAETALQMGTWTQRRHP